MRPYVHNPDIFRKHYIGRALPAFQGQRMQYGASPFNLIKRIAASFIYQGIKFAAPHLAGSAGKLAQMAIKKVFPKQPQVIRRYLELGLDGTGGVLSRVRANRASLVEAW